jgi:DNA replication protein DnaC
MVDMKELKKLAGSLGFRAIEANWDDYSGKEWLVPLLRAEEKERDGRGLQRRIKQSEIGQFKPIAEFDWSWPQTVDREQIEELFSLNFIDENANAIFLATNGLGKTMISQNLLYKALLAGYNTRFVKASKMLDELLQCADAASRRRRIRKLCRIDVLAIDEVGYMSYDNRYADLLYEVVSERYQKKSTIITTNKAFTDWGEIFPNAACVVTMVDRLTHNAELVLIEGKSYRLHEAEQKKEAKEAARKTRKSKTRKNKKEED